MGAVAGAAEVTGLTVTFAGTPAGSQPWNQNVW
jgi:hypothetical protein